MNERIQELSEQAQLYARQGMGKCVIELKRFDADAVLERYTKDFEEKFAELIVKECSYRCYLTGEYQMAHELSDLYGFKFDFKKMMEEDDE